MSLRSRSRQPVTLADFVSIAKLSLPLHPGSDLHHYVHLDGNTLVRRLKTPPIRLYQDETLTIAKHQPVLADKWWQSCKRSEPGVLYYQC
jgi:hypothetical protein